MTDKKEYFVRTPLFPIYSEVRKLLKIWDGTPKSSVRDMINAILEQTGTPKNPVDWSAPDEWIDERLSGETKTLANRIWQESGKTVNPRHTNGSYLFINTYGLLLPDASGTYRLTDPGKNFLNDDQNTVALIDVKEGLPKLLAILAGHSPAKRGDLLEEWGEFLLAHSKYGTAATIKDTLRRRILNLIERGYIGREGNTYLITEKGAAYAADVTAPFVQRPHQQVIQAIKTYNDTQTQALRERLGKMNP
jgi:restriction system protein